MSGSSVGQLSSYRAISYIFSGWMTFVAMLMLLAGHHAWESIGAALVVALQFTAGFVLWQVLSNGSTREIVGATAMGAVFGSIVSTLSGIFSIGSSLAPFSWLIPLVGALVVIRRVGPIERASPNTLRWLIAASLLGLSTEWTWLIPIAIASVVLAGARRKRRVLVVPAVLSLISVQIWILFVRSPYWSQFRHGLTEVADYVYLEAVARGAMQWGHTDNVLTSGTDFGYHWLSFAWAGRITEIVDSTGMAFSSHLVQVTFVVAAVGLTFAVTRQLGGSEPQSILASLATAVIVGFPYGVLQTLAVLSPSQPFAVAAVLATFLHLASRLPGSAWRTLLLVSLFVFGVVGGKVSAIPAAIAGLLVFGILVGKQSQKVFSIALFLTWAVTALFAFMLFYGGVVQDGTTGTLQISLFEVAYTEGPLASEGRSSWLTLVGVVAMGAGIVSLVPGIIQSGRFFQRSTPPLEHMLVLGGAASLCVGFVYVGERAGIFYFFNMGVALLIPVSSARLPRIPAGANRRLLLLFGLGALSFGVLLQNLHVWVSSIGLSSSLIRSLLLMSPLLVGSCVLTLKSSHKRVIAMYVVLIISMSSFVAWVPRFSWVQIRNGLSYQPNADSVSGFPPIREALLWLRQNSSVDEIVATNRFCNQHDQPFPDCPAHLTMVSSVVGRRMYVENVDWSARTASVVLDRAVVSTEFVDSPTAELAEILIGSEVSWVFVDRSATTTTNWEPWAEVVFENDDVYILRVLKTTGMP